MTQSTFAFLSSEVIGNLTIDKKSIITAYHDMTIRDCVILLSQNKILSVPILDRYSNECLGMIDMYDCVQFCVNETDDLKGLGEKDISSTFIYSLSSSTLADVLMKVPIEHSVVPGEGFVPLRSTDPIFKAAALFAKGIHRAPLITADDKIIHVVSQSTLIKFIHSHINKGFLSDFSCMTLGQLKLGLNGVVGLTCDASVLSAIRAIRDNHVTAVALLDESGSVCGNFSASDLRGIYEENFPSLLQSCTEYLKKHSPNSLQVVVAESSMTVAQLLSLFVTKRIHRVWVIDSNGKPQGVVSLTDIIRVMLIESDS